MEECGHGHPRTSSGRMGGSTIGKVAMVSAILNLKGGRGVVMVTHIPNHALGRKEGGEEARWEGGLGLCLSQLEKWRSVVMATLPSPR